MRVCQGSGGGGLVCKEVLRCLVRISRLTGETQRTKYQRSQQGGEEGWAYPNLHCSQGLQHQLPPACLLCTRVSSAPTSVVMWTQH